MICRVPGARTAACRCKQMERKASGHLRIVSQGQDLAEEGDRLLPKRLRIADVAHDHLVEGMLLPFLELRLDLTR